MEKIYNPKNIEKLIYQNWEKKGCFKPNGNISADSYCIMMPPPNVTGDLHMGHAFQQTLMDILIRYNRMQGKNTLWQVGTDHAGIATQLIIENKIFIEEGKTKKDYNRDTFIKKVYQWKQECRDKINNQMRRLGNSVDWESERFTMDEKFSEAVIKIFIQLYSENLIYRKKRLVNWDCKLHTAISDLEVENRELVSKIWYLRYPLLNNSSISYSNNNKYIIVATTRPETIFGDVAIAVNPDDVIHNKLIGSYVIVPLVNRCIPVIGDKCVDINFGSSCVKITPAHDFNDYKIAKKHNLPMINILNLDGNIRNVGEIFNSNNKTNNNLSGYIPKEFCNINRFDARKKVVLKLNSLGMLADVKKHTFKVPYGDRSGVIIEPMLIDQWYLRTSCLAKKAIKAVEQGLIHFISNKYKKIYINWMNNIEDWCISRQLWWGHRIPAWYDNANKNIYVGNSEEEIRNKYKLGLNIILSQDCDVLDTWFSSSLWSFVTLGWPDNLTKLNIFHPTNVIISGFDIIFFWIARMIMLTMHFIKNDKGISQVPFKKVYLTGLILDCNGKKMSKSLGNVIDPLDIICGISLPDLLRKRAFNMVKPKLSDKICKNIKKQFPNGILAYGADSLRFTLAAISSTRYSINWDMKRLEGYRNFCNKLWNASRFVVLNTENKDCGKFAEKKNFSFADDWIMLEFNNTVKQFRFSLEKYRFDLSVNIIHDFIWNKFCDWYLEFTKEIFKIGSYIEIISTRFVLLKILDYLLRLIHPIIPFITEKIWFDVKNIFLINGETLMLQPFPKYNEKLKINDKSILYFDWIKNFSLIIRFVRVEMNIPKKKSFKVFLRNTDFKIIGIIKKYSKFICSFLNLKDIILLSDNSIKDLFLINKFIYGTEMLIEISDVFNKENELLRLKKELKCLLYNIDCIVIKLNNMKFMQFAPKNIINKEYEKLEKYQKTKKKILKSIVLFNNKLI